MIYKFPVLFQIILAITLCFSPLRGMEEEQVQQQNPFQREALFESIKCVPFEKWKANYPHKACTDKVERERLHPKSQTGTFSIDVFITDKNNAQGALTNPNAIEVCSFVPKAVFFNDIPYIQRGLKDWKEGDRENFMKKLREKEDYFYALPDPDSLKKELRNFSLIFFPNNFSKYQKDLQFLEKSLFRGTISKDTLLVNAILEEAKFSVMQSQELVKSLKSYLLNKVNFKDTIGKVLDEQQQNQLYLQLKEIEKDVEIKTIVQGAKDLHTFLGKIKDSLEANKQIFKKQEIFEREQEIINQWKQDFFSLFKLAFAGEEIGPHSPHQALKNWFRKDKEVLEKEIKERFSSRDFLEQAFNRMGYKENEKTLNNYSSHLETSIPFYIFKHQGFKQEIEKILKGGFPLLVNFTLYTHKNACEGCLGDSFLLWSFLRDTFFKDMPMAYTSVFNEEDKLVLQTKEKTDWQMGHGEKFFPSFSFCNPGDYRALNQNPITFLNLDFKTLYFSAFIEGKEWLPHIYRSKDVQGLMIPFLKDQLKKDFYFSQNNPLWEQLSEQEKEEQLKKVIDFYPISLNTRFRNQ